MADGDDQRIRREPGLEALDDTTLAVRRLVSAAQDLTVRTARRMTLNLSDMTAVMHLREAGPMGVAELARRLGVSSAATTVLVDRLERVGYVERVRDTADRRRVVITETSAAQAALRDAWRPAIEEIDAVCRTLSPSQQAFARGLLDRLTAAMEGGRAP